MSNMPINPRKPFFPNRSSSRPLGAEKNALAGISPGGLSQESKSHGKDQLTIDPQTLEFMKIKNATHRAPELTSSGPRQEKIQSIKQQIKEGNYTIDYNELADKMIADSL